jgi:hypothetical protein
MTADRSHAWSCAGPEEFLRRGDDLSRFADAAQPRCGHCGGPLRGYAAVNDAAVCHPDEGLDCYRLVTVYGHPVPCGPCAYAGGGQGNTVNGSRPS